jgi:hypothetical protein
MTSTSKPKDIFVWLYYSGDHYFNDNYDLCAEFEKAATLHQGEFSGSGMALRENEYDISFSFYSKDNARKFIKAAKQVMDDLESNEKDLRIDVFDENYDTIKI